MTLLSLFACDTIWVELPKEATDSNPGIPVPDTSVDSEPGQDTAPSLAEDEDAATPELSTDSPPPPWGCPVAAWSWGADNTSASAEASFEGIDDDAEAVGVIAAGDMDGDGVSDLAIGAQYEGGDDEGAIYFLVGGIERTPGQPLDRFPHLVGAAEDRLGGVDEVGDTDGDGLADVSLSRYSSPEGGDAWLFRGRAGGWPTSGSLADADAATSSTHEMLYDLSGYGAIGDVDGDGDADWLLRTWYGACIVSGVQARGNLELPADCRDWLHTVDTREYLRIYANGDYDGDGRGDLVLQGDQAWPLLGARAPIQDMHPDDAGVVDISSSGTLGGAQTLGDLDGDGDEELGFEVNGGSAAPGLYVFTDSTSWDAHLDVTDAELVVAADEGLFSASGVGDVNGDGIGDLAITTSGTSEVWLFFGRSDWPATVGTADADVHLTADSVSTDTLYLPEPEMRGDLDGDGIGDLVLRIPSEDVNDVFEAGRVSIYRGRRSWPTELGAGDADATFVGQVRYEHVGGTLLLEDIDGDGCDDLVTSTAYLPDGLLRGTTSVYFGQGAL